MVGLPEVVGADFIIRKLVVRVQERRGSRSERKIGSRQSDLGELAYLMDLADANVRQ
jgi:hypothetical protein